MSGQIIRVSPPRTFDFSDLVNSGGQSVRVAERIDCSQYQSVDLIVRVHADASIATGASISLYVVADGFTADDPSQDFFSLIGQTAVVFSSPVPTAGTLSVVSYTSALGSMLAVFVNGVRASTGGAITARVSIDLALREC